MNGAALKEFDYFYQFQNTPDNIRAVFSNRKLNTGFYNQSESEVRNNRLAILSRLDLELAQLVCAKQIHSNGVYVVGNSQAGRGAVEYSGAIEGADALITKEKNLVLGIFTADCLSIFIIDAQKDIIALAHAGWRGTKESIVKNTIFTMAEFFKSNPQDIMVYFGPAIRKCCYEVGKEFLDYFKRGTHQKNDRVFLDLVGINYLQLREVGILEDNIFDCNICTFCQNDKFFSFRREKDLCGRQMSLVVRD